MTGQFIVTLTLLNNKVKIIFSPIGSFSVIFAKFMR
jgi:hypothetical protein